MHKKENLNFFEKVVESTNNNLKSKEFIKKINFESANVFIIPMENKQKNLTCINIPTTFNSNKA